MGAQVAALSGVAAAAVYSPQQALPAQAIQQFLADPAALLAQYPDGGGQLIARVRDLAASDPATLDPLIGLLTNANQGQATAIGTALGQVATMAVKTDQAYAVHIQEAIASADKSRAAGVKGGTDIGSDKPKIGSAVTTKNQVEGVTERGAAPISVGSEVYLDELVRTGVSGMAQMLFVDRTNLSVGPVTEIRLDKFVFDPGGGSGNVVLVATQGVFRFITGALPSKDYTIRTPFASLGVRGTAFNVVLPQRAGAVPGHCATEDIELLRGEVIVTTISSRVVPLTTPNTKLTVDCHGGTEGPTPTTQPIVNFAALGDPVTHFAPADAQFAFNAVTGNVGLGAAGVGTGGGGGGGGGTGAGGGGAVGTGQNFSLGGGFLALTSLNLRTAVATTPSPQTLPSLTLSTSSTTTRALGPDRFYSRSLKQTPR